MLSHRETLSPFSVFHHLRFRRRGEVNLVSDISNFLGISTFTRRGAGSWDCPHSDSRCVLKGSRQHETRLALAAIIRRSETLSALAHFYRPSLRRRPLWLTATGSSSLLRIERGSPRGPPTGLYIQDTFATLSSVQTTITHAQHELHDPRVIDAGRRRCRAGDLGLSGKF